MTDKCFSLSPLSWAHHLLPRLSNYITLIANRYCAYHAFIDMEFFTLFTMLRDLDLRLNRLIQLSTVANNPVVLRSLYRLSLNHNQLTVLNLTNWIAPQLGKLELNGNHLTQLPLGIGRFEDLVELVVSSNQLTTLDLHSLQQQQQQQLQQHDLRPTV
ncbi:LOW QUALITY PROTEIN: probable serine/threonine-protein kinase drkD [Anopheles aquasalis]|uniref:LOW QUALITY PROTEIN: probable serine/threonine-protein kinase drkD n=1 Tax=Anopheles aquasalis TaxID=42839 RepID=UPI00215B160D|nr:LOW QUALITY PROTEIN: probable serine/threonine-protein kinase drkD [Anopheles aquasalis]